ncbi:hypothetical protein GH825_30940, partial [Bacillus thuringiensis]|nr:hypothetical protein [Bacillus thuringiensis]
STPLLGKQGEKLLNLSSKPPDDGGRHHCVGLPFERKHVVCTLLHVVQMTLGYTLMLIVMTFNVSLMVSVVVGSSVGN